MPIYFMQPLTNRLSYRIWICR